MKHLSLLVPGILGPLPELASYNEELLQCPALRCWLSRGYVQSTGAHNYYQQLAQLFNCNADFSIASVSAVYDGADCSSGHWYRADPVHFKTDIDHAILLDQHQLNIRPDESASLIAHFNRHFVEDGLQLYSRHADRWYLVSENEIDVNTTRIDEAVGRDIKHFLPGGEHALSWRRLLNEAQMLFHNHDVNEQRADNHELVINSLWLWGEGEELTSKGNTGFDWLMSNEAVSSGLAMLTNQRTIPFSQNLDQLPDEDHGLVVIDDLIGPCSYGDVDAWIESLETVYEQWLEPLNTMLKKRKLGTISLYTGEGRMFQVTANHLMKFWRRTRPLNPFVNTNA